MALASLRNSDNMIMDVSSVDDQVAARSRPGEVAKWFREIGYKDVRDDSNFYFCKGRKEIEAFDRDMRFNRDVCLFVNDNLLDDGTNRLKSTFMNYCVVVDEPPEIKRDRISLSVYSWGEVQRIPTLARCRWRNSRETFRICLRHADVQLIPRRTRSALTWSAPSATGGAPG